MDENDLYTEEDEADLAEILLGMYAAVWAATMSATAKAMGLPLTSFEIPEEVLEKYMDDAAKSVVRITETTRDAIREQLKRGTSLKLTSEEVANGVPSKDYRGLRGLFEETWNNRERLIAETEMSNARLRAQRDLWPRMGVKWAYLTDGDFDAFCSARNETVVPASKIPELAHPNCKLRAEPLIGDEE